MNYSNKSEALLDKLVCKAIRTNLDGDMHAWPPVCNFFTYQPYRPEKTTCTTEKR